MEKITITKDLLNNLYFNQRKSQQEIAKELNVSQVTISKYLSKYGITAKNSWSEKDVEYLKSHYGNKSVKAISKYLNRSISSVIQKARRLGLKGRYLSNEYLSIYALSKAIGVDGKVIKIWITSGKLAASKHILSKNKKIYKIYLKDFWDFVKENEKSINWYKFKHGSLCGEPDWVEDLRKKNCKYYSKKSNTDWTKEEDSILKMYWDFGKSAEFISTVLKRSPGAVKRRAITIDLKPRHIKLRFREIEDKMILEMKSLGKSEAYIAEELGRNVSSVNSRVKIIMSDNKKSIEGEPTKASPTIRFDKKSISL